MGRRKKEKEEEEPSLKPFPQIVDPILAFVDGDEVKEKAMDLFVGMEPEQVARIWKCSVDDLLNDEEVSRQRDIIEAKYKRSIMSTSLSGDVDALQTRLLFAKHNFGWTDERANALGRLRTKESQIGFVAPPVLIDMSQDQWLELFGPKGAIVPEKEIADLHTGDE